MKCKYEVCFFLFSTLWEKIMFLLCVCVIGPKVSLFCIWWADAASNIEKHKKIMKVISVRKINATWIEVLSRWAALAELKSALASVALLLWMANLYFHSIFFFSNTFFLAVFMYLNLAYTRFVRCVSANQLKYFLYVTSF